MNRKCLCFVLVVVPLLFASALAQSTSKELKRTAHRLRIPVEQLKNARAALQEATDLSRRLSPVPMMLLSQMGDAWIQLDRSKASSAIESIYTQLSDSAAKSTSFAAYQQATGAAQGLMGPLADLDPDKALQLIRRWPDPPVGMGEEAVKAHDRMEAQFQSQVAQRLIWKNPSAAIQALPSLDSTGQASYGVRGQLALQLSRSGQKAQADKIVDQVIADFQRRTPDVQVVQEFGSFLQNLSSLDSGRFQDAFGLLAPVLAKQSAAGASIHYQIGDQAIDLTSGEDTLLNLLRGMQGRPQLVLTTLDSLPDLKAKVEKAGGLDSVLNPNNLNRYYSAGPGPYSSILRSTSRSGVYVSSSSGGAGKDSLATLYEDLRGKAEKNPATVRSRLNEVAGKPEQLHTILNVAQRASWEDPDLSRIALEVLSAHLDDVEPLQNRASLLQNLLGAYRQTDGEVDSELYRNGFILADKLRQKEEQDNPDSSRNRSEFGTQADQLEAALVSEYSRDNYDAAIRFLKSKPDDNMKLMMLLRVVQALRSSY